MTSLPPALRWLSRSVLSEYPPTIMASELSTCASLVWTGGQS
jgi:hypothetical protein